jgi:hypothetical protein
MRRYRIARYLSDAQKARMVGAAWAPTVVENGYLGPSAPSWRAGIAGDCPLAVATGLHGSPGEADLAWHLTVCGASSAYCEAVERAVVAFVRDWDAGQIPPDQLAQAIGYQPAPTRPRGGLA